MPGGLLFTDRDNIQNIKTVKDIGPAIIPFMVPKELPLEVLDNLPTRRVKPIVEQVGPRIATVQARAAAAFSLGDLKVFGVLVSALGVAVGLAVMALAFGLGASMEVPPQEAPPAGDRPLGPGLGRLAPAPRENPYDARNQLACDRGDELLKAVDAYASRSPSVPLLIQTHCAPRQWQETVPPPRPRPSQEVQEPVEPPPSPKPEPPPVAVQQEPPPPPMPGSVAAARPPVDQAVPVNEDLAQVLDGTLAPRARFAAWARLSPRLNSSGADLVLLAQMLGEGGNLHLEWSIVARLRELTGQDFGRDRAAWSEWLKDPKPVAVR